MALLILCIKIFFVRILDVSLGTIRMLITVKGKNWLAALVGFVEIFIWFVIVKEALNTDETSIWIAISYAGGFATGTYIGGLVSNKFIKSNLSVNVITNKAYPDMVNTLRNEGFAVTVIDIKGQIDDDKYMLFIEISSENLNRLKKLVKDLDRNAFIVINETKYVQNGFLRGVAK